MSAAAPARPEAGPLEVVEVGSLEALAPWAGAWRALAARAEAATLFETWEWVTTWVAHSWAGRPLAFLLVTDGPELVGAAPFLRDEGGDLGCAHSLVLPVNPHAKWSDVLCRGDAAPIVAAMLAHLREAHPAHPARLPATPAGSDLVRALEDPGPASRVRRIATLAAPRVRNPGGWEAYEAALSKKVRHELRRKERRLEREHATEHVLVTAPDQVAAAYADVLAIEAESWKDAEGTSLVSEPGAEPFYRELAGVLADAGWLRLHVLRLDGRPAAHVFAAAFRGVLYAFKTSYDQRFSRDAPGLVVIRRALRHAFEDEGLGALELLGESSRWKDEIADDETALHELCVYPATSLRCRWCALRDMALRPAGRRVLGLTPRATP